MPPITHTYTRLTILLRHDSHPVVLDNKLKQAGETLIPDRAQGELLKISTGYSFDRFVLR